MFNPCVGPSEQRIARLVTSWNESITKIKFPEAGENPLQSGRFYPPRKIILADISSNLRGNAPLVIHRSHNHYAQCIPEFSSGRHPLLKTSIEKLIIPKRTGVVPPSTRITTSKVERPPRFFENRNLLIVSINERSINPKNYFFLSFQEYENFSKRNGIDAGRPSRDQDFVTEILQENEFPEFQNLPYFSFPLFHSCKILFPFRSRTLLFIHRFILRNQAEYLPLSESRNLACNRFEFLPFSTG